MHEKFFFFDAMNAENSNIGGLHFDYEDSND